MSSEKVHDYLAKQLSIENSVVTFRLLSREMRIHVSAAKQALEEYRTKVDSAYATYLISGSLHPNDMDIDQDEDNWDEDFDPDDRVEEIHVLLAGQDELEESKSQFSNIHSVHVYSLSPARLIDADLICLPTEKVRQIDATNTPEQARTLGRVIGSHVTQSTKIAKGKAKAQPAAAAVAASLSKLKVSTKDDPPKEKEKEKEKPKTTGKLDFSKAKSKDEVKKEKDLKQKELKESKAKEKKEKEKKVKEEEEPPKRGLKRKSTTHAITSDEESVQSKPSVSASSKRKPTAMISSDEDSEPIVPKKPVKKSSKGPRIKKGVVISDDEDEKSVRSSKSKGKVKFEDSDNEKSLRAMMDIDDNEVEKITHFKKEEEEEDEEDEVEIVEEDPYESEPEVIKPKPRKRKEKKVIPLGKNGLPKKKTLKSRMKVDDKGYMVTEDYSSYESVDEDQAEPEAEEESDVPKKKPTKSAAAKSKAKPTASSSSTKTAAPVKEKETTKKQAAAAGKPKATDARSNKSAADQKNLMNFFGKKA